MANGGITKDTKISIGVILGSAAIVLGVFTMVTHSMEKTVASIAEDVKEIRTLVREGDANVRANTILVVELRAQIKALENRLDKLEKR